MVQQVIVGELFLQYVDWIRLKGTWITWIELAMLSTKPFQHSLKEETHMIQW